MSEGYGSPGPEGGPEVEVLSEVERARQLVARFPEMAWPIHGFTHATPESSHDAQPGKTVFEILYPNVDPAKLSEPNRAFVGVRSIDWVRTYDRDAFTACQKPEDKVTPDTFDWLHRFSNQVLDDETAVEVLQALMTGGVYAMGMFVATNDIGKYGPFADIVRQIPGVPADLVDHDLLMYHGLKHDASLSPSFQAASPKYQRITLEGLSTGMSPAQFNQLESVAADLVPLEGISEEGRLFHYLHSFYDIAGAAGQFIQNGSATMTESSVKTFQMAMDALDGLGRGKSAEQAYQQFVDMKAEQLGLDASTPDGYAVTRLSTMMRMSTPERAAQMRAAYDELPEVTRAILEDELAKTGLSGGVASKIYYSPAILLNLEKHWGKTPEDWHDSIKVGLTTLARLYMAGRTRREVRQAPGNAVQTIFSADVASLATKEGPVGLANAKFNLVGSGLDVVVQPEAAPTIDLAKFPRINDLAQLPGERVAVVGMGGGTDGVQAAIMAKMLERAGKTVPAVVSIRTVKPQSAGADGVIAERRTLQNHGGELAPDVHRITTETQGTGRFVEHLPAGEVAMFQVGDDELTPVTGKLQTVIDSVGGVDLVIGLDTGGDMLYLEVGDHEIAVTSPDQDRRSLSAVRGLAGVRKMACGLAVGIDTPDNAEEILLQNNAAYYEPDATETDDIIETYHRWHLDGTDDRYFGKTPLAWQAALRSRRAEGVTTVNLPLRVVTSPTNPWNPFVVMQPAMRGAFFIDLDQNPL